MNEIKIKLRFKKYLFKRVKPKTSGGLAHTPQQWIGKKVLVIPVPMTVTDRLIESTYDENTQTYEITLKNTIILNKEIKGSTTTGRIYLPNEYIGYDMLIIEQPPHNE